VNSETRKGIFYTGWKAVRGGCSVREDRPGQCQRGIFGPGESAGKKVRWGMGKGRQVKGSLERMTERKRDGKRTREKTRPAGTPNPSMQRRPSKQTNSGKIIARGQVGPQEKANRE